MSIKSPRPENFPWLSPYLIVQDVQKSRDFYKTAFGFQDREGGDNELAEDHAELQYHDQVIMIGREGAFGKTIMSPKTSGHSQAMSLYLYVDDIDSFYQHAREHGALSQMEPQETFWGDRMCSLEDINGFVWAFATNVIPCQEAKANKK